MEYRMKVRKYKNRDKVYQIQEREWIFWRDINVFSSALKEYAFKKLKSLRDEVVVSETIIY